MDGKRKRGRERVCIHMYKDNQTRREKERKRGRDKKRWNETKDTTNEFGKSKSTFNRQRIKNLKQWNEPEKNRRQIERERKGEREKKASARKEKKVRQKTNVFREGFKVKPIRRFEPWLCWFRSLIGRCRWSAFECEIRVCLSFYFFATHTV